MAETTKGGGFHAFEQRVHQMEEEHEQEERKSPASEPGAKREATEAEKSARREPKK